MILIKMNYKRLNNYYMSTIIIPTPFRKFTSNKATFQTDKKDVFSALNDLTLKRPGLKQYLFKPNGELKSNINLLVDNENYRESENDYFELKEDSLLAIIPLIYGG